MDYNTKKNIYVDRKTNDKIKKLKTYYKKDLLKKETQIINRFKRKNIRNTGNF